MTTARKLTYADYAKIPDDGFRHEIVEGEEFMTPAPNPDHQAAVSRIDRLLGNAVDAGKLGRLFVAPTDVLLSPNDIVQPDLFFIAESGVSIIGSKNIQGAPDLAIEVSSPSTSALDRGRKLQLYERSGVREYWIVDLSARTVEIHEFGSPRRTRVYREEQSFESVVLPRLTVPVSKIL